MWRPSWLRKSRSADPYEDFYLNAPPADPQNLVVNRIRRAPEGSVFAVKSDTHTPEVMARHVKELGAFFGAEAVHIAAAESLDLAEASPTAAGAGDSLDGLPIALFMLFRADHDPRESPGIGGHAGALKGAVATFQVGAIIREWGFRATRVSLAEPDKSAALVGLGTLDRTGRLKTARLGTRLHIADVILTDLPVQPDWPPSGAKPPSQAT